MVSVLGSLKPLPQVSPTATSHLGNMIPARVIYGELGDLNAPGLAVYTKVIGDEKQVSHPGMMNQRDQTLPSTTTYRLCLFKLNMPADGTLQATMKSKRDQANRSVNVGFYTAYRSDELQDLEYVDNQLYLESSQDSKVTVARLEAKSKEAQLVEFGVYCKAPIEASEPLRLIGIESLIIKPIYNTVPAFAIHRIATIQRGEAPEVQKRLTWDWQGSSDCWPDGMPWSKTTGPFSHFIVLCNGREVGKAHCLEFPLSWDDLNISKEGDEVEVTIDGYLFGGGKISSLPKMVLGADLVSE